MHIPDGFVNAPTALVGGAVAVGGLALCAHRAGTNLRDREVPLAGLAAAFFLVLEAPIFPLGIGTAGHLLGGTLAIALLGPYLGPVVVTVVTVVQALFAGEGGISVLGVNVVNAALVPALVGWPLLLLLRRILPKSPLGVSIATGITAVINVLAAALVFTG
ncbi:cobalamin biosynthesis protein CbiM [Pseudonocardiaceae bacterium YIM PH 21723]|nr:cobalamin biosynthesis protein CbiM [Pseudonocardiaceae bacterium YIM PH 21723]